MLAVPIQPASRERQNTCAGSRILRGDLTAGRRPLVDVAEHVPVGGGDGDHTRRGQQRNAEWNDTAVVVRAALDAEEQAVSLEEATVIRTRATMRTPS